MRLATPVVLSCALVVAMPALADDVTVLRGTAAPLPPAPPVVVQTTVVVPQVVYVPTYDPGYVYPTWGFWPGVFVAPRRGMHQQAPTTVQTNATGPLRPLLR